MIDRVRALIQNLGLYGCLCNLAVLGFAVWLGIRFANDPFVLAIHITIWAGGLILPLLFKSILLRHINTSFTVLRWVQRAVVVYVVLLYTNVVPMSVPAGIAVMFVVAFAIGTQLWLLSDPCVLTARGLRAMDREIARETRRVERVGAAESADDGALPGDEDTRPVGGPYNAQR